MGKKSGGEELLIHVIVRTHRRKELFMKCLESIAIQKYENKMVHVTADDAITAGYVRAAIGMRLVDTYYRVDRSMFKDPPELFTKLLKNGLCRWKDRDRCLYNLYLNYVIGKIPAGWVFIVDDDKQLPHDRVLSNIAKMLTDDDVMAVGQYAMKSKTVPDGVMWKKVPFVRGEIDMSCMVWNVKHKNVSVFDGHKASDWRVANYLARALKLKWAKEPFVVADNDGMFGAAAE
jgi:hypothetical protein